MPLGSRNFDWTIFVCALVLSGFGTAVIGSVALDLLGSQILFYVVGFALFFLFAKIDHRIYKNLAKQGYVLSILLLLLTLFIGFESRGATRWISLFGFRLQFSEFLKPFILTSLACFLADENRNWKVKDFLVIVFLAFLPAFLIFKQPDLGSAIVYLLGFGAMIFVSGINLWYLVGSLVIAGGLLPLVWHFLASYQKVRILSFLNPTFDPLGASYNAIQAQVAVGSGILLGWGLGRGTQSQLLFLPEHHTDFVFASLSEELGFVGASLLLLVYFILIQRILTIFRNCPDRMGKLLSLGLGVVLLGQVSINVGMNLGLVPVTGITLPLVSYGGSSILATMISLGILESIATGSQV